MSFRSEFHVGFAGLTDLECRCCRFSSWFRLRALLSLYLWLFLTGKHNAEKRNDKQRQKNDKFTVVERMRKA